MFANELDAYFKSVEQYNDGLLIEMPTEGTRFLLYLDNRKLKLLNYGESIKVGYDYEYSFRSRHLQINFRPLGTSNSFKVEVVKDLRSFGGELETSSFLVEPNSKNLNEIAAEASDSINLEDSSTPEPEPVVAKAIEKVTQTEPAIEEPAEVVIAEPAEEDVKQSTNWWLWLIGAMVVLGGIVVFLSRK